METILNYIVNNRIVNVDGWYYCQKNCIVSEHSVELYFENTNSSLDYYIMINLSKPFKFSLYRGEKIQKKAFQKAFYKKLPRNLKIQKLVGGRL